MTRAPSPVPPSLADNVLVALRRIIRATDLHSRQLLRSFGVTTPQLIVLQQLATRGPLSGSALARSLSVSLPTATDVVARLEERGLVERARSEEDRREVLVTLTDSGRELVDAAPPPLNESFAGRLQALAEWEQTQILSVLQRIVAMMDEVEPVADAPGDDS